MLHIYDDTHPVLREKAKEVTYPYSKEDISTLKEMVDFLIKSQDDDYAKKHNIKAGVGLAAPQIGISKRMFAVYIKDEDQVYKYGLINPVILRTSVKKSYLSGGEGCLSVPTAHPGLVMRYYKTVIQGYDVFQEKDITITAYGYLSICIQHEYDHLDGILYYDHIDKKNPTKKDFGAVEI